LHPEVFRLFLINIFIFYLKLDYLIYLIAVFILTSLLLNLNYKKITENIKINNNNITDKEEIIKKYQSLFLNI